MQPFYSMLPVLSVVNKASHFVCLSLNNADIFLYKPRDQWVFFNLKSLS